MEVRTRTFTNTRQFIDLPDGKVCLYDGEYYIKLPSYDDGSNALRLSTDTLFDIPYKADVIPVNGYFQETD